MSDRVAAHRECLVKYFGDLPDPRSSVNRRHLLLDIVVISICAVTAGADGPVAIAEWAQTQKDWLSKYLELPHGIPAKDCFRRVLMSLNPLAFQQAFQQWTEALIGDLDTKFIHIDGKTLRRSHDKKNNLGALHLVSAWSSEHSLTLGQVATAEKSNEITAIPLLLEMINVKGAIVTIDAMGCQKAIAAQIIEQGGDYILPVKGNQKTLEQSVEAVFTKLIENDFKGMPVSRLETEEICHGRVEKRTYLQVNVPKTFGGLAVWRGLKTLGMVIRTREIDGVETGEVQYYITSIKRNVKRFAKAVRSHWGIENCCHWVLDVNFREDEQRARERGLAENLGWLRRFAIGLLKRHPVKRSLAMRRRKAGWSAGFLSEILFGVTT